MNPEEKVLFHKNNTFDNTDKQKYSIVANIIKQMKQVIIDVHEANKFSVKYKCRNYDTCKWCEYKKICEKIK